MCSTRWQGLKIADLSNHLSVQSTVTNIGLQVESQGYKDDKATSMVFMKLMVKWRRQTYISQGHHEAQRYNLPVGWCNGLEHGLWSAHFLPAGEPLGNNFTPAILGFLIYQMGGGGNNSNNNDNNVCLPGRLGGLDERTHVKYLA